MKLNFPKSSGERTRLACDVRRPAGHIGGDANDHSRDGCAPHFRIRHSENGIALVLTLILLSVTLVMAIAFLAISHREQGSVVTSTDTTTARLAADSALANAEAQIMANLLSTTNPFSFGLLVSTNYINANAFTNGSSNPLNVNYYDSGGNLLTGAALQQNIANLFYLPRAPVFIVTNQQTGATDFRYYLDLNRNGKFEDSGLVTNLDNIGEGLGSASQQVGDPQWIGVLERPDTTHGPNNKFLSRYAFIALPAGNSLDLNAIHNQTMTRTVNASPTVSVSDGYYRNQGVGSWEINLAAFLTDLNTNQWETTTAPYNYLEPGFANTGFAFQDALALLSYRYDYFYNSLSSVQNLFNLNVQAAFLNNIDFYSDLVPPLAIPNGQIISRAWAGADNTNHFFTPAELFNSNEISAGFVNRLVAAGNTNSTYDRYTFYRLLAQLGTDSTPESGKMNLNYDNLHPGFNGALDVNGTISPTNFVPWTAIGFFTNAADRMLHLYTANWFRANPSNYLASYYGIVGNYYYTNVDGTVLTNDPHGFGLTNYLGLPNVLGLTNDGVPSFGITNIPVWVNGRLVYSSAMQRVLQLVANIYDATTNNSTAFGLNYPSVFRPTFWRTNQNGFANVYVNGYQSVFSVSGTSDPQLNPPIDVTGLSFGASTDDPSHPNGVNVYGVPWIIGAKMIGGSRGFPNFNEFSMNSVVQINRQIQVTKQSTNFPPVFSSTNVTYIFGIGSSLGVELWNSYATNYPNPISIVLNDTLSLTLTNGAPFTRAPFIRPGTFPVLTNTTVINWPGSAWNSSSGFQPNSLVFQITNITFLTNEAYQFVRSPPFQSESIAGWETSVQNLDLMVLPQLYLLTTNRLQAYMLDGNHIIDYVQFGGPNSSRNLNTEVETLGVGASYTNMWTTNTTALGASIAIQNQFIASEDGNSIPLNPLYWHNPNVQNYEIDGFYAFMTGFNTLPLPLNGRASTNAFNSYLTNLVHQIPFTPTVTVYDYTTWQANDPLVHYLASDLSFSRLDASPPTGLQTFYKPPTSFFVTPPNIGLLNDRYGPWGAGYVPQTGGDPNKYNFAYKDSLVTNADAWDFPVNKFPTVGWLGRVHRGTPWQTVYLKATNILNLANSVFPVGLITWTNGTGNGDPFDAANARPTQDHLLFDIFSTAPNDNATRGQLSVNVGAGAGGTNGPSLAAWSAVFSGIVIPTNFSGGNIIIQPAGEFGLNSSLGQLVGGINSTRANTNLFPQQAFAHVGDILATPQLTEQSPFLGFIDPATGTNDELMEWLPQQTMSLLRASSAPRYVIYSYGQTLKPAPNGIVTSGSFFGMVANYQIAAEIATRAVVRVEGVTGADGTPLPPSLAHPHIVIESYNILPPD